MTAVAIPCRIVPSCVHRSERASQLYARIVERLNELRSDGVPDAEAEVTIRATMALEFHDAHVIEAFAIDANDPLKWATCVHIEGREVEIEPRY